MLSSHNILILVTIKLIYLQITPNTILTNRQLCILSCGQSSSVHYSDNHEVITTLASTTEFPFLIFYLFNVRSHFHISFKRTIKLRFRQNRKKGKHARSQIQQNSKISFVLFRSEGKFFDTKTMTQSMFI